MRILVAEDDKVVSTQICGILRNQGYVPTPVFDSLQAMMSAMRPPHPDAVILDISMPGGTGVETLKRLKSSSRTNAIPVFVVSGTLDPKQADKVIELGAEAFFTKPLASDELCAALERALGSKPAR